MDLLTLFVSISFPFLSDRPIKKTGAVYKSIHFPTNATFGSVRAIVVRAVFSGTPFASYFDFLPPNKTIYFFNEPNMVTKITPVFAEILR